MRSLILVAGVAVALAACGDNSDHIALDNGVVIDENEVVHLDDNVVEPPYRDDADHK